MLLSYVLVAALPMTAHADAKRIVVRAGSVVSDGSPWAAEGSRWADGIAARSKGRLHGRIIFSMPKEAVLAQECMEGRGLDMFAGTLTSWTKHFPPLAALELPHLFTSAGMAEYVLDHHLFEPVRDLMRQGGVELWRFGTVGWHGYGTTFGPVTSPDNLAGHRIRAQPGGPQDDGVRLLGAVPVELDTAEVLGALKSGAIDAIAHAPVWFLASSWSRHIRYFTNTRHRYQVAVWVYCKGVMDRIPADLREALLSDRLEQARLGRLDVHALEAELLHLLRRQGVDVVELDGEARRHYDYNGRILRSRLVQSSTPEVRRLIERIRQGKSAFREHTRPKP